MSAAGVGEGRGMDEEGAEDGGGGGGRERGWKMGWRRGEGVTSASK